MSDYWRNKRVVVTGATGFLGGAIVKALQAQEVGVLLAPTHERYDLRQQDEAQAMIGRSISKTGRPPDVLIHCAAHVGGIGLNRAKPADLLYDNVLMNTHVMHEAMRARIPKFVGVGTVCAYPAETPVPFLEDAIWTGFPEVTNAPYGIAKRLMLLQGQVYRQQYKYNAIHVIPTNLYGPGDNFDPVTSHVIPALIHRMSVARDAQAPEVAIWGDGSPTREFLYVDDAAQGILMATQRWDQARPMNLGGGGEISIYDLAQKIAALVEYKGKIRFDKSMPNGQWRRKVDTRRQSSIGFEPGVTLDEGLRRTVLWYNQTREYLGIETA